MIIDRSIAIDRLCTSTLNVRHIAPSAQNTKSLIASIRAMGVIQSLLVREVPGSVQNAENIRYEVGGGARRLHAAREVAVERDEPQWEIPCRVALGEDAENGRFIELSLAENTVREGLHLVDEVTAYCEMKGEGATVEAIARNFGTSEHCVRQRLKLGNAAPAVLKAHRTGEIDRKTFEAFALCTDAQEQTRLIERLRGGQLDQWKVRQALTETKLRANDPMARYVGLDAYTAQGGAVIEDLFPEHDNDRLWITEPERMRNLAQAKLDARAHTVGGEGWAWIETDVDGTHAGTVAYERAEPSATKDSTHARTEINRLEEAANNAQGEERWKIEQELDHAIVEMTSNAAYDDATKAKTGVIVGIGHDGRESIVKGLIRPHGLAQFEGGATRSTDAEKNSESGNNIAEDGKSIDDIDLGIAVRGDLRYKRNEILKRRIATDPDLARDLLTFQIGRALGGSGAWSRSIGITLDGESKRGSAGTAPPGLEHWVPENGKLSDVMNALPMRWAQGPREEGWRQFRELGEEVRNATFAACIASLLNARLANDPDTQPEIEMIAAEGIDWARQVRPEAERFWNRIAKPNALKIAGAVLGEEWAKTNKTRTRTSLAPILAAVFAGQAHAQGDGLDENALERARTWCIPGLAPKTPEHAATIASDEKANDAEQTDQVKQIDAEINNGDDNEQKTEAAAPNAEQATQGAIPSFLTM